MTKQKLFESFVADNTKNRDRINPTSSFFRTYGNVSFKEAFEIFYKEISQFDAYKEKIDRFEKFLIKNGCERIQSSQSESRYYRYEGLKFRFSSHVYPTGSMTNLTLGVIDLASDPELIEKINFE